MLEYKCPECGAPMTIGERHCANCDYDLTDTEYAMMMSQNTPIADAQPHASVGKRQVTTPEAVMAHGNVDISQHHSEDKSTHHVDNSQTVNNTNQTVTNNFIIMGGSAPTPPNIDPQTAAALEQVQRAQQETHAAPADEQKGVGAINGNRRPIKADVSHKELPKWFYPVITVVVATIVLFFIFRPNQETASTTPAQGEQVVSTRRPAEEKAVSPQTTGNTTTQTRAQKEKMQTISHEEKQGGSATVSSGTTAHKSQTVQAKDPDYESGMTAYNANDGLTAIKAFKASNTKESVYMLGIIYEKGCGNVSANALMAHKYFKQAAEMGHSEAKSRM